MVCTGRVYATVQEDGIIRMCECGSIDREHCEGKVAIPVSSEEFQERMLWAERPDIRKNFMWRDGRLFAIIGRVGR